LSILIKQLRKERHESFITKTKKLYVLIKNLNKLTNHKYKLPIINLSNRILSEKEKKELELGLYYCFVNKNRYQRKQLSTNFETITQKVTPNVNQEQKEDFHEFMRGYTDIFIKNIHATKDYT